MTNAGHLNEDRLRRIDSSNIIVNEKRVLRQNMRRVRQNLSQPEIEQESQSVQKLIIQSPEFQDSRAVGAYFPINNEMLTEDIIGYAIRNDKSVCLPKVVDDSLIFLEISNLGNLKKGRFNVPEPTESANIVSHLDMVLVPGLAFDLAGHRIGYGRGFYDRFLKDFKGFSVGLAYEFQVVEKLPTEEFDVRLKALAAGKELLRFHDRSH